MLSLLAPAQPHRVCTNHLLTSTFVSNVLRLLGKCFMVGTTHHTNMSPLDDHSLVGSQNWFAGILMSRSRPHPTAANGRPVLKNSCLVPLVGYTRCHPEKQNGSRTEYETRSYQDYNSNHDHNINRQQPEQRQSKWQQRRQQQQQPTKSLE